MKYKDVVISVQNARKKPYGNRNIDYKPCKEWLKGDQINLWTYWQGYQIRDIDEKGVDILMVGQDWGNPFDERNSEVMSRIRSIQRGDANTVYYGTSPTDKTMAEMFLTFGADIKIFEKDLRLRLFFTNYSLGYREGSETGGMTIGLMKEDKPFFDELVLAIRPKIIICLGKLTYEMVSGERVKGFSQKLQEGIPFKAPFPLRKDIVVYGVAHCGSRGQQNVGGKEKMRLAWDYIAREFKGKYGRQLL